MTNRAHELILQKIDSWKAMGIPAILEQYIERNGEPFETRPFPEGLETRGVAQQCFQNSFELTRDNPKRCIYVEGYVVLPQIPILIHHAWVWDAKANRMIDPTIRKNEGYSYYGVRVPYKALIEELIRCEHYGIFQGDIMVNFDWIARKDPKLFAALVREHPEVKRVVSVSRLAKMGAKG